MKTIYKKKGFSNKIKKVNFLDFEPTKILPSLTKLPLKYSIVRSVQNGRKQLLKLDPTKKYNKNKCKFKVEVEKISQPKETGCEFGILDNGLFLKKYQRIVDCQNKIDHQLEEIQKLEKMDTLTIQNNIEIVYDDVIESFNNLNII